MEIGGVDWALNSWIGSTETESITVIVIVDVIMSLFPLLLLWFSILVFLKMSTIWEDLKLSLTRFSTTIYLMKSQYNKIKLRIRILSIFGGVKYIRPGHSSECTGLQLKFWDRRIKYLYMIL